MATTRAVFEETARYIRALDAECVRLFKNRDTDAFVQSYYAEDARVLPPGRPAVQGKAAILEFWRGFRESDITGLELDTTDIEVSGDLAYGVGNYATFTGASAKDRGKYVVVYRRQNDGGWKAVVDMFSSNG